MKLKKLLKTWSILLMILFITGCNTDTSESDLNKEISVEDSLESNDEKNTEDNEMKVTGEMEVHFMDVGQADAALVICEGKYMLIDGGNKEDSSLIYAYLKENEAEELDYIICSHAHEDHCGGLAGALNYAKVKTVYAPVQEYDTEAYKDFVKYVKAQEKDITIPSAGEEFSLGNAKCRILAVNTVPEDCNNTSIVLRIEYGNTSFLFTGDAETVVEKSILNAGYELKSTVLKVPHHGSDTSLGYQYLNEILPEYAVISVGEGNSYGHPSEDSLSKLRDADVKVYRTDMQGHIIARSDGKNVTFTTERKESADTLKGSGAGSKNEEIQDKTEVIVYVLNMNTQKFHHSSCNSVEKMSEKNKVHTDKSRDELIEKGYSPCGNCNP